MNVKICNAAAIIGEIENLGKCSRVPEGDLFTSSMRHGIPSCGVCGGEIEMTHPGYVTFKRWSKTH